MEVSYKTLSIDDMYKMFVDYSLEEPYEKIKKLSKEIKYLNFGYESYHTDSNKFFCAFVNNDLVGVAKLKIGGCESCANPGWNNWIGFVSVS